MNKKEVRDLDKHAHMMLWHGVPPLQACRWCRQLVQDSDVEPNPGPSQSLAGKMIAVFCNCSGHEAVYRVLDAILQSNHTC
jgi:hypothetical protein